MLSPIGSGTTHAARFVSSGQRHVVSDPSATGPEDCTVVPSRGFCPAANRRGQRMRPSTRTIISAARTACVTGHVSLMAETGARAQITPLFGNEGPFLNRATFALADATARKLPEPQPAAMGTVANWADAASGNSGAPTMGSAYQRDGHDYRTMTWADILKSGERRTVMLATCGISGIRKLM